MLMISNKLILMWMFLFIEDNDIMNMLSKWFEN